MPCFIKVPMEKLNSRAEHILGLIIDSYIKTGSPVGSKTLAADKTLNLSSASIRNVMSDLEKSGLLYAPHTSSGRLPTENGLSIFVKNMLEVNSLSKKEQDNIRKSIEFHASDSVNTTLEHTSRLISGLSACAGLVVAPKMDRDIKEVEFLKLSNNRVLAILVYRDGQIENRLIDVNSPVSESVLRSAGNYINSLLAGHSLNDIQNTLNDHIKQNQGQLDDLTATLIKAGVSVLTPDDTAENMIIRGQAHLLDNVNISEDIERLQHLFTALEEKNTLQTILSSVKKAQGVQIYIGSENSLFEHSGCSLIISPYKDSEQKLIGAIGVIGPTRLNYRRVIPIINYTSEIITEYIK